MAAITESPLVVVSGGPGRDSTGARHRRKRERVDIERTIALGTHRRVVEAFANADPYVREGLVANWCVREWTTVMGKDALTKVV